MHAYPTDQQRLCLILGNDRVDATDRALAVENPADLSILGHLPVAGPQHVEAALAAARGALGIWSGMTALQRGAVLHRAADILRERQDAIARTITLEQGKPLAEARIEVQVSADILDWQAEEGRRLYGRIVPSRIPQVRQSVHRIPLGVVALFAPWNFPMLLMAQKVAAALAAGCTVVAKPAEETPGSALALFEALLDAGAPGGAVNVLFGDPAAISEQVIASHEVRKVSLTGSARVGRIIGALAGRHLKKSTLELGGHAPVIVTRDANIEHAARLLCAHKFRNAGQVCVAPTRFYVERPVAEAFAAHFIDSLQALRVGHGLDPATQMGPLASQRQLERTRRMIDDAAERGGQITMGSVASHNVGHFHPPTIVANVPDDALAMQEEPFGPIALLQSVDTIDQAIEKANALPYALGAYAFTGSHDTARRLSERVVAGMIAINHTTLSTPETPFGGTAGSGHGAEGGIESILDYTYPRVVSDAPAWP